MYQKLISVFLALALVGALTIAFVGCAATTYNADGTVVKQEVDEGSIQLAAVAVVAAWAASQGGITEKDADMVMAILNAVEEVHEDGAPINVSKWSAAIQAQVPERWKGLSSVVVMLVDMQLKKYGVSTQPLTPHSDALKVLNAIREGAKMGLAPYIAGKATPKV